MDTRIYEIRARSLKFPDVPYYGSVTEEYKSAVKEYWKDKNQIYIDFRDELLVELGIKDHPKSEYLMDLVEIYSDASFQDRYGVAKELVKLMEVKHAKEIDSWEKHYKGGHGCVESVYREESICKSIEIAELREYIEKLEAKVDRLMLEYCPEEMTQEQLDNWSNHQICVKENV